MKWTKKIQGGGGIEEPAKEKLEKQRLKKQGPEKQRRIAPNPNALSKPSLALIGSGQGSLIQFLCEAASSGRLKADIAALITDNARSPIAQTAKSHGLPFFTLPPQKNQSMERDQELLKILQSLQPSLILLLGFLKKIGPLTLQRFRRQIINSHPSLLPDFGGMFGMHVHQAVLSAGKKETGPTLHFVTEEYDKGPIVAQGKMTIKAGAEAGRLQNEVKEIEKRLLLKTVRWLLKGRKKNPWDKIHSAGAAMKRMTGKPFPFAFERQRLACGKRITLYLQSPPSFAQTAAAEAGGALLFLKGGAIGISLMLPGFSAATAAYLLRVYKKLVDEVSQIKMAFRKKQGKIDIPFLLPLSLGAALSLPLFAFIAHPLIKAYPQSFQMIVFALALGGLAPFMRDMLLRRNPKDILLFALFGALGFGGMIFINESALPAGAGGGAGLSEEAGGAAALWTLAPAGLIAGAGLALPGLSGSYLLVLLGLYESLLQALRSLSLPLLGAFLLGAAAGAGLMARLMSHLLKKRFYETCFAIAGFVLGSLALIMPF